MSQKYQLVDSPSKRMKSSDEMSENKGYYYLAVLNNPENREILNLEDYDRSPELLEFTYEIDDSFIGKSDNLDDDKQELNSILEEINDSLGLTTHLKSSYNPSLEARKLVLGIHHQ